MSTETGDVPKAAPPPEAPAVADEKKDAPGTSQDAPKEEKPDSPKEEGPDVTRSASKTDSKTDSKPETGFLGKLRMPILGPRSQSDKQQKSGNPLSPVQTPDGSGRRVTFDASRSSLPMSPLGQRESDPTSRTGSHVRLDRKSMDRRRSSIDPRLRPEEAEYHDSRAATRREFRRRATTLQEYYRQNPTLLPQLPFTFRHGFKRWKLGLLILFMVFDACVVPIILYYAMTFGGNVQGYITFAVVTAIWGGPAYFEFAIRSWRLILKERFFRPMGVSSRWAFDITNWIFVATITATTILLIVGAAPHIVWLRVLSMPGPALLLTIGICLATITLYHSAGWKAPFRISSTPKGQKVHPGVYYIVEDVIAVNAGGGLPFREGFAARYEASPIFRKMIRDQSLFWSIGSICMGTALTVIVCVHTIKKEVVYGVGKLIFLICDMHLLADVH